MLAQLTRLRGPIRKQQDFFVLMIISNQHNSFSQACNNFFNVVTGGANSKMSSAYNKIYVPLCNWQLIARTFKYLHSLGMQTPAFSWSIYLAYRVGKTVVRHRCTFRKNSGLHLRLRG